MKKNDWGAKGQRNFPSPKALNAALGITLKSTQRRHRVIKGRVIERGIGGLKVDINGVEAFLPGYLVDARSLHNLDIFKGQEIEVLITEFNRKHQNVVLAHKVFIDEKIEERKRQTFEQLGEGFIVEAKSKA